MSDDTTVIDVTGISKAKLFSVLYNHAKPVGMGFLHYDKTPMSETEAAKILHEDIERSLSYKDKEAPSKPAPIAEETIWEQLYGYFFPTKKSAPLPTKSPAELRAEAYEQDAAAYFKQYCPQVSACRFDYVKGRLIKTDISKDQMDLWLYLRDNTHVSTSSLKTAIFGTTPTPEKAFRPTEGHEYLPYFTKKIIELRQEDSVAAINAYLDLYMKCMIADYDLSKHQSKLHQAGLDVWDWNNEYAVTAFCKVIDTFAARDFAANDEL